MCGHSENFKARILFPMILSGAFLIFFSVAGAYWLQNRAIDNSVHQRAAGTHRLFKELIQEETRVMGGQIDFIKTEKSLFESFQARDRKSLMEKTKPLFERMRSKYRITHFYFHGKDQICFLRVHSPERYGDLIERFTMKGAVSAGKPFNGIELGPLGTFTLRLVYPWIMDGKLEGYIELGMEIEHITRLIKQSLNLDLLVLIEKRYLDKSGWEAGLKLLNRKGNWELFNNFVIIDRTMAGSPILNDILRGHLKDDDSIFSTRLSSRYYKGQFKDLIDAGGRRVGKIVSLVDITDQHKNLWRLILLIAGLSITIGLSLALFFNTLLEAIQYRLITSRENLQSEIDTRRKSEEALEASEKRFRSLFEESKDAIFITDKDGNLQMVNPAGMDLFGLSEAEITSSNISALFIEQSVVRKFIAAIFDKGYVHDFGVQLKGKNGKVMDCLMTVNAKKSTDGAFVGYEGIIRDVTPYKRMEEELRLLATTDSLTGVNNRRNFIGLAQKEINRSQRYGYSFSLLMLDIDHFKNINDTYGHSNGDQVLIDFCRLCLKEIRENDIFGRLGGEEFAIALIETDTEGAKIIAKRIKGAVSSHSVIVDNDKIRITVSLGITELCPNEDLETVIARADSALYQAKEDGRNLVRTCLLPANQPGQSG